MRDESAARAQPHELKWVLPARRSATVARWLGSRLRLDPRHPRGLVISLYYDTPGWRLLAEKTGSDFLKSKLRVRWYEDADGRPLGETAFVEVKTKTGARRDKLRLPAPWPASILANMSRASRPLSDPRLDAVVELARRAGAELPSPLLPAFALRYERLRYVDSSSGSRVSLDREIALHAVHPRLPAVRRPPLEVAVVEVKGSGRELPASLRRLPAFGARLTSFSKYAACHALLTDGDNPVATGLSPS